MTGQVNNVIFLVKMTKKTTDGDRYQRIVVRVPSRKKGEMSLTITCMYIYHDYLYP